MSLTNLALRPILPVSSIPKVIEDTAVKPEIQSLIQRAIIGTSFFPLTWVYGKIYALSVKVARMLFSHVDGVLAVYLRRGVAKDEIVYGLSDIDLLLIVDDREQQLAKERVRAIYDKLARVIPLFGSVDRELGIYSTSEFLNLYEDFDFYKHWFNEGKYSWKLLYGTDVVKTLPQLEDSELYLPATEELKAWWSHLVAEFNCDSSYPEFKRKYLWYKAISEAAKIYLFVRHGEIIWSREAALRGIKNHLNEEYRSHIDRVIGYRRRLTAKGDLLPDELMSSFILLVGKSLAEMERKVYGDAKGKVAIVNIPHCHDLVEANSLTKLVQELEIYTTRKLEPNLDYMALIPQVEFSKDILDNADIDSSYLVMVQRCGIPIEKLREFWLLFDKDLRQQDIEPFIVIDDNVAFSLWTNKPASSIKSPKSNPLFFSLYPVSTMSRMNGSDKGKTTAIRSCLPPNTFEETIRRRTAKINRIVSDRSVFKMKTLDFLRFFWGAARTKLLAHSLESNEIHIALTSKQILEMLLQSFPADLDWLMALHREYTKELRGKENEAHRFFSESVRLLSRI